MKQLFLLLVIITGFAVAQDYEGVDPSGQSITFWHQHSGEREEALQQIVADFNSTNEWGITVTAEYQGGYSDIFQKMLPLLGTADTPNLVVAYQNQAASYKLADGVLDLDPLVSSATWGYSQEELADFFPSFIESDIFPTFNNERLAFPPNRSMEVLYYNAEWLRELGYDAPPATPEEFREMACAAAQQPFSKATSEGSLGYELSIDASRFASWTFAFGGDIFDGSQYTLNSDAAVEAMTFIQSLFADGCASIVTENFGDQTNFGAGRTLFTVGSSSGLPFYQSAVSEGANFEWSVSAIPHTTPEPVQNIYGASVSIPTGHTPEANLATWLFIKYYTSPEVQTAWAEASQYFPVRQSVAEGLADYFAANPSYQTAFNLLQYGKAEPSTPGYEFVRSLIEENMTVIADGEDVATTLASINEEANNILSEQMADMPAQ
jgi:multiple sugar transport system substrate-binding protein